MLIRPARAAQGTSGDVHAVALGGAALRPSSLHGLAGERRAGEPAAVEGIVIGASTGGPQALAVLLTHLRDRQLNAPIFLAIHMPAEFNLSLAALLQRESQREVRIPQAAEEPRADVIYIPAGGSHIRISRELGNVRVSSQEAPADSQYRPSVDLLFSSAAKVYRDSLLAVVLTGMGHDGLEGARLVAAHGGAVFAQNDESCVVASMPGAVVAAGLADVVAAPADLARRIVTRSERARHG
ncbi:MAG: cheB1 [Hyphomicrobiales bacterium]|nr:cheB1 [Hyphomicrobiales bacterium]